MATQTIDLAELKYHEDKLEIYKDQYDETINKLIDLIKTIAFYWQDENSENFRNDLYRLVGKDLNTISKEITGEVEYLKKLILVLENAQQQIKNKLNS